MVSLHLPQQQTGLVEENNTVKELGRDWDIFYTTRISFYPVFPNALLSSPTKPHALGSSESFARGLAQSQDFLRETCEGLEQKYMPFFPIFHFF